MPNRDRPDRDGHDDLDTWLHDRIDPLPPPPGTFEAIRRRARRRKFRKLAVSAGAAVAIIAAAVTVPQVVQLPIESGRQEAGSSPVTRSPVSQTSGNARATTAPAATPSSNPVPHNFQPSSVTAVSSTTVFTIGQAGTPGQCSSQYCTSVARTSNAGQTWTGLPAPVTGAPDGATGVGQIRFLEGVNGWAFGPELWATHDGGLTWNPIKTHGQRVIDVETVGDRAFAIEATCTGRGADFSAQCTSFTLYSTLATLNRWTKVGTATSNLRPPAGANSAGSAALVLTSARGYLLAPGGKLYAGPPTGAAWHAAGTIPCDTGQAQLDGEPAGALLGAVSAQQLLLACAQTPNGTTQAKLVYSSPNGGQSWQQLQAPPTAGVATSIAASPRPSDRPAFSVVLGTSQGIEVLPSGSGTWHPASIQGTAPTTGFSFVGMTTDTNGMALPADPVGGAVWFTADGGLTWKPSQVQGTA